MFGFTPTASAVNYFGFTNAATGNSPVIAAIGSNSNISLTLQGKGTSGVPIKGVTDASDAAAGYVGEYMSSVITSGSAVSLVNGTAKNVTSISLTAGDWDVSGEIWFTGGATTQNTRFTGGINTTTNALPTGPGDGTAMTQLSTGVTTTAVGVIQTFGGSDVSYLSIVPCRINVSSTTTVYLVARVNFTVSTCSAYGKISARRIR